MNIEASVLGDVTGEVVVLESPVEVLSYQQRGFRLIGRMRFLNGTAESECLEKTVEGQCFMIAAVSEFSQLVAARLRERSDYPMWRSRILAMEN